ncbi:hypothetical protein BHM03_00061393 [Ensete ventricosum]|nr:hypothetical protein BHM03_00061393 [Ensete ventricosum]
MGVPTSSFGSSRWNERQVNERRRARGKRIAPDDAQAEPAGPPPEVGVRSTSQCKQQAEKTKRDNPQGLHSFARTHPHLSSNEEKSPRTYVKFLTTEKRQEWQEMEYPVINRLRNRSSIRRWAHMKYGGTKKRMLSDAGCAALTVGKVCKFAETETCPPWKGSYILCSLPRGPNIYDRVDE